MTDTTTTVAAEQIEQPAGARPVSPLRRARVWVAVVGVVAVGAAALAASDLAAPASQGGLAARYLPPDGTASLVTAADGTRSVHEHARDTGPGFLLDLPPLAAAQFFDEAGYEELRTAQLWRASASYLDEDRPQTTTLYRLDDRGVSMLASLGGEVGFSYSPGVVMLPADAAPGVSWEGEGDAMPGGLLRYEIAGEIADAGDDCLLVRTHTRYLDPSTGDEALSIEEEATWCPGRGIVLDEGDVSGTRVSFTTEALPDSGGLGGPLRLEASPDWGAASGWRPRELAIQLSDPAYGSSPQGVPFDGLAVATPEGFVASVGGRLAGYSVERATASRRWVASPGGDLLRLAAVGEVVLVSTTERRLIAYDARGARMWSTRFPDVVAAEPVAGPDGDVLVVSLDGTLRRIDLATGEIAWSVGLRTDAAESPAVVDGVVVVVDRGGAVLARDLATGAERWSAELPGAQRVAAGDGVLVVQAGDADVWVLDPSDGGVRWEGEHVGVAHAVAVAGGWVVSQSDAGALAWRVDGGERGWHSRAGDALLSDGRHIAIVGDDVVEVRRPDGTMLAEFAIEPVSIGVTRAYLPTESGIRILHTDATGWEVR